MNKFVYTYLYDCNVIKLKSEIEADPFFNGKIESVKRVWDDDRLSYDTVITLNYNIGVNESMLRGHVVRHDPSDIDEVADEYLVMRIKHGELVIRQFRLMVIELGVSGSASLSMFELLKSLASMLRMGLLDDACTVLENLTNIPLFDSKCIFDKTKTVRQYFIDLIQLGNYLPT